MKTIAACVLLWPLVHATLVARFHIDPWELFGWSMYALPAARVQVAVEVERDGESTALFATLEQRRRIRDFARRRTALGELASSAPLAREILAEDASLEAVLVRMREIRLDLESARLVAHEEQERHTRDSRK
jgi:hypothetical protein